MAVIDRSTVSIRFGGKDLDPDLITAALGEPTYVKKKGHPFTRGERTFIAGLNLWLKTCDYANSGDVDLQIAKLLSGLSQDTAEWRRLTGLYRSDIFVGLFMQAQNEGFGLAPETRRMVGERGLKIDFDVYAPDRRRQAGRLRRRYRVRLAARYTVGEP